MLLDDRRTGLLVGILYTIYTIVHEREEFTLHTNYPSVLVKYLCFGIGAVRLVNKEKLSVPYLSKSYTMI